MHFHAKVENKYMKSKKRSIAFDKPEAFLTKNKKLEVLKTPTDISGESGQPLVT